MVGPPRCRPAARVTSHPEDRSRAAREYIESVGGRLRTTVLPTVEETLEALHKVDQVGYRPPGT
ncbi:hypothetical protein [Streptomyces yangpuensis]|uniref:hypothetical protein n=1 Tax=Streptomyces yangpuensis TaxID=1648182 RepID=UPI00368627BF